MKNKRKSAPLTNTQLSFFNNIDDDDEDDDDDELLSHGLDDLES